MPSNPSAGRARLAASASRAALATALLATPLLAFAAPARAADASVNDIEKQIRSLQAELHRVKVELARKDAADRVAAKQAANGPGYTGAVYGRDVHGNPVYLGPGTGMALASNTQPAGSPYVNVEGTPHNAMAKLGQGTFMVGGVSVTLGGFLDVTGVYRSRAQPNDIASDFNNNIPFAQSPLAHENQFLLSGRESRLSILAQGDATPNVHLAGYYEMDFQGAAASSNSRESNSYVLRTRVAYGSYYNHDLDLKVLGGQMWSLATAFKIGLQERQENIPLVLDQQYTPGFFWARQAAIRVVKGFDNGHYHLGLSFEEPQNAFYAGPNGAIPATTGTLTTTFTGAGTNNPSTTYTDEIAPDTILKFAADPGWGHYEVFGLMKFINDRLTYIRGGGHNNNQIAGGGGGSFILPLIKGKLDLQGSGAIGEGMGRYGSSQLPDATTGPGGSVVALKTLSATAGLIAHPSRNVDLYAYFGTDRVLDAADFTAGGKGYGYGDPLYSNAGCDIEGSATTTCVANTKAITQGTAGFWWRLIRGPIGTVQTGLQYSYTERQIYSGVGGAPKTNENMVFMSFRYLPFQ